MTTNDRLPNLIIAGVRKGGTTSLSNYLAQHPDICSSKLKKVGYFLPAKYGQSLDPIDSYASFFDHASGEAYRMEATPGYFLGAPEIPQLMAETLPNVRVIITLREPVDALWSYYRWVRSHNRIDANVSFEGYIDESKRLMADDADLDRGANALIGYRGVHYAEPLAAWSASFGDRLLIVDFDKLSKDPSGTVRDICVWLGLEPPAPEAMDLDIHNKSVQVRNSQLQSVALAVNQRAKAFFRRHRALKKRVRSLYYAVNRDRGGEPTMSPDLRDRLRHELEPENARLATVLAQHGTTAPNWLNSRSDQ